MASDKSNKLILICVDSSEHSSRAFEWYCNSIHRKDDVIGLVHVHVPPSNPAFGVYASGSGTVALWHEEVKKSVDKSKELLQHYKETLAEKRVDVENNVKTFLKELDDSIGHTICSVAKENNASLLIIGQRGLGAFRRTLFGSVSDYVLHHTHVPVAVVPPRIES